MLTNKQIGTIVKNLDTQDENKQFGVLLAIQKGGKHVVQFYDNSWGFLDNVSTEQPIEDSFIEISLRNVEWKNDL